MCQTHGDLEETMAVNVSPCLHGADVLVGETENNQVEYDYDTFRSWYLVGTEKKMKV